MEGLGWKRNERVWGIYMDVVEKWVRQAKQAEIIATREEEVPKISLTERPGQVENTALALGQGISTQSLGEPMTGNTGHSVVLLDARDRQETQTINAEPEIAVDLLGTSGVPLTRPNARKRMAVKRSRPELSSDGTQLSTYLYIS